MSNENESTVHGRVDGTSKNFRLMVYGAMFAFVVLALYGYFLIYNLTRDVHSLATDVSRMTNAVETNMNLMSTHLYTIDRSTQMIAHSTVNMQRDMWSMNQNVSTPLSMMNSFLPWSNNVNGPYPGSRPPAPMARPSVPVANAPQ